MNPNNELVSEQLIEQPEPSEQLLIRAILWQVFAEQLYAIRPEIITHAAKSESPILSGMRHTCPAPVDNTGQAPTNRQEVREAGVAVSETNLVRQRRQGS